MTHRAVKGPLAHPEARKAYLDSLPPPPRPVSPWLIWAGVAICALGLLGMGVW